MFKIHTIACAALVSFIALAQSHAAEIKLLASPAVKAALDELVPQFERATGHKIAVEYGTAAALRAAIESGGAFDVAALNNNVMAAVTKAGKVTGRTDLVRSGTGVAVRKGAPKPDISTVDSFKAALIAANSIAFVEQGATGVYLKGLFERLGLTNVLKPKIKSIPGTTSAALIVAQGGADIGITQVSEILPYPDAELVGLLPADIRLYTEFAAALSAATAQPEAAKRLIEFLTAPSATDTWLKTGLEPLVNRK